MWPQTHNFEIGLYVINTVWACCENFSKLLRACLNFTVVEEPEEGAWLSAVSAVFVPLELVNLCLLHTVSTYFSLHLPVRKIIDIYCVSVNRPGELELWPLTMAQILAVRANKHHRRIARAVSCRCVYFHQNWRPKIFKWILELRCYGSKTGRKILGVRFWWKIPSMEIDSGYLQYLAVVPKVRKYRSARQTGNNVMLT